MADADTPNKRSSTLNFNLPFKMTWPVPDGAIDQADRQHSIHAYSGILAGAAIEGGDIYRPRSETWTQ